VSERKRSVELPEELCAQLEKEFGKPFATFEDLLVYVMQTLTQEQANQMDEAERKILEQRLRDLGYL
jgi:translation initiation factor 2 alpha subunit (eIF-2alpha)